MSDTSGSPLDWLRESLEQLEQGGLRRDLRVRSGPQRARALLDAREFVHFGANDYLDLAADRRVVEAACGVASESGWGSGASPLISGHTEHHKKLADALARFERVDAALLFASGFAANAGTIPALVGPGDSIFADQKNHASLIDGCRLSGASIKIYRHADANHLESLLSQSTEGSKRLIVTDSLFSMDGDFAPLAELADLRARYGCMLLIDEAHATGVFGAEGRGVAEMMDVEEAIDIKIGTLSKALGASGGFICGRQSLIDYLANRARTYIFSTSPPAPAVAAAAAALQIVEQEPQRRETLRLAARTLRRKLSTAGWKIADSESQIIPLRVGSIDRVLSLGKRCAEDGLFIPAIRPPSVPEGECLLRLSLCYGHGERMLEQLIESLSPLAT